MASDQKVALMKSLGIIKIYWMTNPGFFLFLFVLNMLYVRTLLYTADEPKLETAREIKQKKFTEYSGCKE